MSGDITHFHSIGFAVDSPQTYLELGRLVIEEGDELRVPGGAYRRWAPGADTELWAQVGDDGALAGLDPHFAGEARLAVRIDGQVASHSSEPLSATLQAAVNPAADDAEDLGDYPFVFDAHGLRREGELLLPARATVQVAAFAEQLDVFADEAAFTAAQEAEELQFAPRSFIPTGMFGRTPAPHALLHGTVAASERRVNPVTDLAFTVIGVQTLGGRYDVVAHPGLGEPPAAGAIVRVGAWLSGRVEAIRPLPGAKPAAAPRARGMLRRLLGR